VPFGANIQFPVACFRPKDHETLKTTRFRLVRMDLQNDYAMLILKGGCQLSQTNQFTMKWRRLSLALCPQRPHALALPFCSGVGPSSKDPYWNHANVRVSQSPPLFEQGRGSFDDVYLRFFPQNATIKHSASAPGNVLTLEFPIIKCRCQKRNHGPILQT
jgi:hypothetical protein